MHLHASAAGFYGRIRSPEPARRRSAHADYDTSMLSVRRPALALTTVPQAYWMMATVSDSAPARRAVARPMRNALPKQRFVEANLTALAAGSRSDRRERPWLTCPRRKVPRTTLKSPQNNGYSVIRKPPEIWRFKYTFLGVRVPIAMVVGGRRGALINPVLQ